MEPGAGARWGLCCPALNDRKVLLAARREGISKGQEPTMGRTAHPLSKGQRSLCCSMRAVAAEAAGKPPLTVCQAHGLQCLPCSRGSSEKGSSTGGEALRLPTLSEWVRPPSSRLGSSATDSRLCRSDQLQSFLPAFSRKCWGWGSTANGSGDPWSLPRACLNRSRHHACACVCVHVRPHA